MLRGSIHKNVKPRAQPPLKATLVHGFSVDISHITISRFLYGSGTTWALNSAEFDYRWDIVRSGVFQQNEEQREAILLWLARYIVVDGQREMGQHTVLRVSPTKADNALTWDRAVMVAALVDGFKIDCAPILLAEIHERAFRITNTLPFLYMIFQLCRDFGVPIWHCDKLVRVTGTLDIGLFQDGANVAAPRHGPQIEVPPLRENLVDDVKQMQGDSPAPPAHTDDSPASPSQAASQALAHPEPPIRQVLLSCPLPVFENWRIERRMEHMMNLKVQAINKCLDTFELRVLKRPPPTTDICSLLIELDHFRADLDAIIAPSMDAPESAPIAPADDTVLDALYNEDIPQSESTRARGKRHRSSHTSDATEDARAKKRECQHTTYSRRASILDKELRQQSVRESTLGASSSVTAIEVVATVRDDVSTTDGAAIIDGSATDSIPHDVSITDGVVMIDMSVIEGSPHVDPAGSGKSNPPDC
uniref:Integrase core domain containing protein n=1 Tax=Solanum tuberosum TaxID=4113 RepID=M1DIV7_SOLTU